MPESNMKERKGIHYSFTVKICSKQRKVSYLGELFFSVIKERYKFNLKIKYSLTFK